MVDSIEVFKCGILVKPTLLKVEGMITCICVRFEKINYEITYFNNGEPKTVWMHKDEFETVESKSDKIKLGFKS